MRDIWGTPPEASEAVPVGRGGARERTETSPQGGGEVERTLRRRIMPADVTAAIVDQMKETFPGETVYTDLAPRNFKRPSNMVELVGLSLDPLSHGLSGVDLLYKYKITTFSTVDEVHASHLPVLDLRSLLVMGAFAAGYIRVKDRAPKVRSIEADTSFFDCVPVLLTLALTLDRADFVGPELHELMEKLEMQVRVKKENDNG